MPAGVSTRGNGTRISSYQARIERSLTDVFMDVPANDHRQAGSEWRLVHVARTTGYAVCELCGHNPIRRLYFIQHSETGTYRMIGSECARNYVNVDLVEAYERSMNRNVNRMRMERNRTAAQQARVDQATAAVAARRARFDLQTTQHSGLLAFMLDHRSERDFFNSLLSQREAGVVLSDRQIQVANEIRESMIIATTNQIHPLNAAAQAATPEQVPHIYNGGYTIDNGTQHLSYKIYTVRNGSLAGKRIVKRMTQYGEYEGFAFVGADGSLILWRRFAQASNETYVVLARVLLRILNSRMNDLPGVDSINSIVDGLSWTVQRSRACRVCNRQLTTPGSIEAGIGPECSRQNNQRTVATNQSAVQEVNTAATSSWTSGPLSTPRAPARITVQEFPIDERRLSEVNSALVQ